MVLSSKKMFEYFIIPGIPKFWDGSYIQFRPLTTFYYVRGSIFRV